MNVASSPPRSTLPPQPASSTLAAATSQRRGNMVQQSARNAVVSSPGSVNSRNHRRSTPPRYLSPGGNSNGSTSTTSTSTVRRLSDGEVRAIFECLHNESPVPPHLKFQIVPVGSNGLKLSPPSYEFQDGLYVLLRPAKKPRGKNQPVDVPKAPEHLQHLVWKDEDVPQTCPWSLSGPQFPQPTAIQQRYCYPKGKAEYSSRKGGALWTMYGRDKKEDLDFRLLHVYFSAKRAVNKGINMAPSAVASATASSSAAVSSGAAPMALSTTSTPPKGAASMMAAATPPRPTKRSKSSPSHYHPHAAASRHPHHHHNPHGYTHQLLSPAMTASSVSQASMCNSPLSFDVLPPHSPGHNMLHPQTMPPLEQSNYIVPVNDPFRHRFSYLEDSHQQYQQSHHHQHQPPHPHPHHQHHNHPGQFHHHQYAPPPPPPPPPRRPTPPTPPSEAAGSPSPTSKPSAKGGVHRNASTMTTSKTNTSPMRSKASPFRRSSSGVGGGPNVNSTGSNVGGGPNINNMGSHLNIQQSPLRRSIPGKHSFNMDNSSDSRASMEAFELDASLQGDMDTDSYWNDPLLSVMLKPSTDGDSRTGGDLRTSPFVSSNNLHALGNVGGADACGSGLQGRTFRSRLDMLQKTIRDYIVHSPPSERATLMATVASWANRLSKDPLSENTTKSITVVRRTKPTMSSSVSSASLETTLSNRTHSYTRDEQQQEDKKVSASEAKAAPTYVNHNSNSRKQERKSSNNGPNHNITANLSPPAPTTVNSSTNDDKRQSEVLTVSPNSSADCGAGPSSDSSSSSPKQRASV